MNDRRARFETRRNEQRTEELRAERLLDWHETFAPTGLVADGIATLFPEKFRPILFPLHLRADMDLSTVSLIAKSGGESPLSFASAIYNAFDDGRRFYLVGPVGRTTAGVSDNIVVHHQFSQPVLVRAANRPFLALQCDNGSTASLLYQSRMSLGPSCGLQVNEMPSAFGEWPRELSKDQGHRLPLVYACLRSTAGLRLYCDPRGL